MWRERSFAKHKKTRRVRRGRVVVVVVGPFSPSSPKGELRKSPPSPHNLSLSLSPMLPTAITRGDRRRKWEEGGGSYKFLCGTQRRGKNEEEALFHGQGGGAEKPCKIILLTRTPHSTCFHTLFLSFRLFCSSRRSHLTVSV